MNDLFMEMYHKFESSYNSSLLLFALEIMFLSLVICFVLTLILSFVYNGLISGYPNLQRKIMYSKYNKILLVRNYNIYSILISVVIKLIPFKSAIFTSEEERSIYTIVSHRWYRCRGLRIWILYSVLLSLLFLCIKDSWVNHISYFFNYQFYQAINLIQSWITNNWIVFTLIISSLGVVITCYKNTVFKKTVKESQEKELHVILQANKELYGALENLIYELSNNLDEVLRIQLIFKGCIYAYRPIEDVLDGLEYKNGCFNFIPKNQICRIYKKKSINLELYCTITACQKIRDISEKFEELKTYYPLTILGAYKKGLNRLLVLHLGSSKSYEYIEKDMLSKENIRDFLDNSSKQAQETVCHGTEITKGMLDYVNELYRNRKFWFESMIIDNIELVVDINKFLNSFSDIYKLHNKEFLDALAQMKLSK